MTRQVRIGEPKLDVKVGSVPFNDSIDFLRSKLDIPTSRWDEMLGEAHAKGFTVAGATKVDLLNDMHSLVNDALANGTTITDFRKGFDEAVQKHGWTYKGKRGWRTRVIFDTNMRTARMAGRWQQFQRVKDRRPFIIYMTVGDGRVRLEHRRWHKIVLRADDAWWDTHFPPNGWGCRCYVINASQRDLDRLELEVSEAPPLELTERINPATGEVYGMVPKGIDVGWDYNVGKAWLGPDIALGQKIVNSVTRNSASIAAGSLTPVLSRAYYLWADRLLKTRRADGQRVGVGYITESLIQKLEQRGVSLAHAAVSVSDWGVLHMRRFSKIKKQTAIPEEYIKKLPAILAAPIAVLWDKRNDSLLYVFDVAEDPRHGKYIVHLNYAHKIKTPKGRQTGITNDIRTGGLVDRVTLLDENVYELLEGVL